MLVVEGIRKVLDFGFQLLRSFMSVGGQFSHLEEMSHLKLQGETNERLVVKIIEHPREDGKPVHRLRVNVVNVTTKR